MYNFIFYHYLKNECFKTEVLQVQEHMTALVLKGNVLLHWNWLKTANIAIKSLTRGSEGWAWIAHLVQTMIYYP